MDGRGGPAIGARVVNAVLGFWLYLSAFLWPHMPAQRASAWVIGMIVVTAALAGLSGLRAGRLVNAALGAWLIISALLLPQTRPATFWNHILVGAALAFVAMASRLSDLRGRRASV